MPETLPGLLPEDASNDQVDLGSSGFVGELARNGLAEDELAEVIYHHGGYAGFPAADTAKAAAVKGLGK